MIPNRKEKPNMMTRRQALKNTALAGTLFATAPYSRPTLAQPPAAPPPGAPPPRDPAKGPFGVPPLPYSVDALEPYIDARTMEIHHDKHHQAYVTNLNKAVFEFPDIARRPAEDMLKDLN